MFIAVQWTSSAFNAWLMAADGAVAASHTSRLGVNAVADRAFAQALRGEIGPWLGRAEAVLLSGMVTGRNGWVETPYAPVPAGLAALAEGAVRHAEAGLPQLFFLPGVAQRSPLPDMMRGEEIGLLGASPEDGLAALPGAHAKCVRVAAGRISGLTTFMSGEIGRLLKADSLVARLLPLEPAFDAGAFREGVRRARKGGILGQIFSVRSRVLFGEMSPAAAASYLDGLLVGAEIAEALGAEPPDRAAGTAPGGQETVTVLGEGAPSEAYCLALAEFGLTARTAKPDPIAGFAALARLIGLD